MGELRRKLAYLKETKAAIKAALVEGGQEVKETDTFRSYADKIRAFQPVLEGLEVTENGEYTPPEGVDGFSGVNVAVPVPTLLENMEVPLDFSNGDMRIEAPNGTAVKSAIIQKPETLVPENIAKDVVIAGIVGTHEGGGSSDEDTTLKDIIERTVVTPTLPKDLTKIGDHAFYKCSELTNIDLTNITRVGTYSFYQCEALTSIDLPNVTSIGSYAFCGCAKATRVNIPKITSITGTHSFYGCSALISVNMPNVTSIGEYVFYNCPALASIDLSNVTSIGSGSFQNCTALKSLDLSNVTTIKGTGVFWGCTALERVRLPATPPTLGNSNSFNQVPTTCIFSIPTGSLTEYQNATNWSSLTSTYSFVEEDR